jgi:thioesterase domain-containing protein
MNNTEGVPFERAVINRFSRVASRSFHPRPLDALGVVIRPKFPGADLLPGYDSSNGWGDLFSRGVEVVQAAGDHVSMTSDENAEAFGRLVNAVLDRYARNLSDDLVHRSPARDGRKGRQELANSTIHSPNQ